MLNVTCRTLSAESRNAYCVPGTTPETVHSTNHETTKWNETLKTIKLSPGKTQLEQRTQRIRSVRITEQKVLLQREEVENVLSKFIISIVIVRMSLQEARLICLERSHHRIRWTLFFSAKPGW